MPPRPSTEILVESDLEIALPSELRMLRMRLTFLRESLKLALPVGSVALRTIEQMDEDLARLVPQVEAWTKAIRDTRHERRFAATKASVTRILKPKRRR